MTEISVETEDPRGTEATALLHASHALMLAMFPKESCHYLSIDDLCVPKIQFFVGRSLGVAVGCGALAIEKGYGEIKSMFTAQNSRGLGVADKILNHIQTQATKVSLPVLRLETGDTLTAAHRLYQRHGFSFCGPFGTYCEHPNSLFMAKTL